MDNEEGSCNLTLTSNYGQLTSRILGCFFEIFIQRLITNLYAIASVYTHPSEGVTNYAAQQANK